MTADQGYNTAAEAEMNHLAFGAGVHFCLGRHLAMRELIIAMATLLPVLPQLRLQPGVENLTDLGLVIQPRSLPLVFD